MIVKYFLKKVDYLIDDVANKSSKLDGVFNIVDRSADALTLMTDRAVAFVCNTVLGFFNKKERDGKTGFLLWFQPGISQ